ncbi:MAG: undecaprenyl-phosphate glucose phosphotransferase [Thiolinea sp.]
MMVDKKISSELIYRSTDTILILSIVLLAILYSSQYNLEGYLAVGLGASLIFGLVGRFTDIYTSWSGRPFFRDEVMRLIVTWLTTFFILVFMIFVSKTSDQFSRLVLVSWLLMTPVLLIVNRYLLRSLLSHLKRLGIRNRNIAILGMTESGLHFAHAVQNQPESGLQVAGFYTHDDNSSDIPQTAELNGKYAHIGNIDTMIEDARMGTWDQIYLALPPDQKDTARKLISKLSDTITPIRLIPDNFTHSLMHSKYLEIADTPVLCIYDAPISLHSAFIKRVEDLIIGSLLLTALLPFMTVIAAAVKLSSPGPVLFKQSRHGLRGEPFKVWKFRTMTVCEDGQDVRQATRNDLRVTRVGAFLRKTSMDELPQFFNVLQGHMSIVGPRPHALSHNEAYKELIPGYMMRHLMKPGITGWAQVNGWRGETDTLYKMQKRVECDMEYIRSWSLWLDLRIIFVTASKTLFDKNAY